MTSPGLPTHVLLPGDMPLAVVVMLQSTIADAWADYEGDPNNPGEFWAYLAGTDD